MSDISDELADLVKLAQDMTRLQCVCSHAQWFRIESRIVPGMFCWKCLKCGQMRTTDPTKDGRAVICPPNS